MIDRARSAHRARYSTPQQSQPPLPLTLGYSVRSAQYDPYNNITADTNTTLLEEHNPTGYDERTLPARLKRRTTPIFKAWGKGWDRAVKGGRWPRVIYALFGAILLGIWIGLLLYFAAHESRYQKKNYTALRDAVRLGNTNDPELWYLEGSLVQFDPKTRVLSVRWSLLWSQNAADPQPFGVAGHTGAIGIYRDQSLIQETPETMARLQTAAEQTNTTDNMRFAGLRIDNSTVPPVAVLGMHSWDDFNTDISLQQAIAGNAWMTPSMGFPFDRWSGSIVFVANYHDLADGYTAPNSFGTYLDDAYLEGSMLNWRVSADRVNTCTNSTGIAVDATPSYPCQLKIQFYAHRPGLVIFATVVAVSVNWLSTIFIFIMTCEGVIMRRVRVIEGPQLLAVCFTALFALPSVRSILPGAPEFGALVDIVGIIPNVIIISLCTTMVSIALLRTMSHNNHEEQLYQQLLRQQQKEQQQYPVHFPTSSHQVPPGFKYSNTSA